MLCYTHRHSLLARVHSSSPSPLATWGVTGILWVIITKWEELQCRSPVIVRPCAVHEGHGARTGRWRLEPCRCSWRERLSPLSVAVAIPVPPIFTLASTLFQPPIIKEQHTKRLNSSFPFDQHDRGPSRPGSCRSNARILNRFRFRWTRTRYIFFQGSPTPPQDFRPNTRTYRRSRSFRNVVFSFSRRTHDHTITSETRFTWALLRES